MCVNLHPSMQLVYITVTLGSGFDSMHVYSIKLVCDLPHAGAFFRIHLTQLNIQVRSPGHMSPIEQNRMAINSKNEGCY